MRQELTSMGRRIGRRLLPMHGYMSAIHYWRARNSRPFQITRTELFGKPLLFSNAEGFFHSVEEIFQRRVYDFSAATSEPYIIDAGANIGLSVVFFKQLYPRSKIVAFEPDPKIFKLLVENVRCHGLEDVDLREAAAWISNDDLTFYSEGSLAGSIEVDFMNFGNIKTIRAERLKTLLANKKVDFLKLDIEGAEAQVLPDIGDELQNVQHLFFEYHSIAGRTQPLGELLSLVSRAGFRYVISDTQAELHPFIRRSTNAFDNQMNVFCFRD